MANVTGLEPCRTSVTEGALHGASKEERRSLGDGQSMFHAVV